MTLIELVLVIAIIAVLVAFAIPQYQSYRDRVDVSHAVSDIADISMFIKQYETDMRELPANLNDVGLGSKLDPWGNPYQYFNITTATGKGKLRKDKSLNPINSDYDLYSMGKDGQSATPLTAPASQDDVIRARDGQFVGLASDF
jgi:general secretion pathway protein G